MNKNSFFGDKYKMKHEVFTLGSVHTFLNTIVSRNARVYKKAQNFSQVERYNFRNEKNIKNLLAMKMLHNENFKDIINENQISAGYLMFTYANQEICPKCQKYEEQILMNFGKVNLF